jgi:creatinine amidohydrolase
MDYHIPADRFLPYLTTREVEALPKEHAVVILPVASIEQHGPHLPVFTDTIILNATLSLALERLDADVPAFAMPPLPYGKSNEHAGYAGTVYLTSETFITVLKEICGCLAKSGFKRIAILNCHGGNTEIVSFVIRDIREQHGVKVFSIEPWRPLGGANDPLTPGGGYDIHAGEKETSLMLAIAPGLVHDDLAPSSMPSRLQEMGYPPGGGAMTFAWQMPDISATGVVGDATKASAEKGRAVLELYASRIASLLQQISVFEF